MARCETCGNDYDKAFQVSMNGSTHTFDSFECAIHALAPKCKTCGIHIMGHGLEKEGILGRIAYRIRSEKTLNLLFEHARKEATAAPEPEQA